MNEGALVFASLIVGIAVTDQLSSLHRLLRIRAQVRWALLPLWTAAIIFLAQVQVWWSIAGEPKERLTIGQFLPTLAVLTFLFLAAAASLPDKNEDENGRDLHAFYRQESRHIWIMLALALGTGVATTLAEQITAGVGIGAAIVGRSFDGFIVLLMLSNAVIRKRWWHVATLAVLSLGPIGWLSRSIG